MGKGDISHKKLVDTKQKFEVLNSYGAIPLFKFADRQQFFFSAKEGLQLVNKTGATRTYKIVPIKMLHYSLHGGASEATRNIPANALLFQYAEKYGLLIAASGGYFSLRTANKDGNPLNEREWISLQLADK